LHVRAFDRGDPAPTDIGERWSFITAAPLVLTAALLSLWNPVGRVVGSLGEALLVALLTLLARSVLSGAVAVARLLTRREMTFRGLDRWLLSSALAILPGAVFLVATGATALPQVLSPEIAQNDHWVAIALGVIGIAAAECRTWAAGQPGQADATSHLIQVDPAVSEPCEPHAA
jgi:hypothetical protein